MKIIHIKSHPYSKDLPVVAKYGKRWKIYRWTDISGCELQPIDFSTAMGIFHLIDYMQGEKFPPAEILLEIQKQYRGKIKRYTDLEYLINDVHRRVVETMNGRKLHPE